jgi:hypothetical protein
MSPEMVVVRKIISGTLKKLRDISPISTMATFVRGLEKPFLIH